MIHTITGIPAMARINIMSLFIFCFLLEGSYYLQKVITYKCQKLKRGITLRIIPLHLTSQVSSRARECCAHVVHLPFRALLSPGRWRSVARDRWRLSISRRHQTLPPPRPRVHRRPEGLPWLFLHALRRTEPRTRPLEYLLLRSLLLLPQQHRRVDRQASRVDACVQSDPFLESIQGVYPLELSRRHLEPV